MKNIRKSKIVWTNAIAALIAILALISPEFLQALGFENSTKFLAIVGFFTTAANIILRIFFFQGTLIPVPTPAHIHNPDTTLKIGTRPRRKKKPTAILPSGQFVFIGADIVANEPVTYKIFPHPEEVEIHIHYLETKGDEQYIIFLENFEVPELEDIDFYFG